MSLPPPPGPKQPLLPSSSLPPRPPQPAAGQFSSFQPAYSSSPSYASTSVVGPGYGSQAGSPSQTAPSRGYNALTAFQPRSVTSNQSHRTAGPAVPAPTTSPASFPATYQSPQQPFQAGAPYYSQQQQAYGGGDTTYGHTSVPQITNPFPPSGTEQPSGYGMRGKGYGRHDSSFDAEMEAQIAQWQSAYIAKDSDPLSTTTKGNTGRRDAAPVTPAINTSTTSTPSNGPTTANTPTPGTGGADPGPKTVVRSGGGQTWTDTSLLEWDPAHFRLFVGNLAGEVTDDSLKKAFSKYPSVQKARVIRDKRTEKSKGYGFVSFSDGDDYFKAAREMQGKYIGSHPVLLRRATTEIRPISAAKASKKGGAGASGTGGVHGGGAIGKVKSDGIKKQAKTRGGLKILG